MAIFTTVTLTLCFSLLVLAQKENIEDLSLKKTHNHTTSEKERKKEHNIKKEYSKKRSFIFGCCWFLFLRCLDRKLDGDHLHEKEGWRWRQHTESMKVFQKMRAKLEPALEEDQKKEGGRRTEALKSTLTTHFSCRTGTGDGGRWTGSQREQRQQSSNGICLQSCSESAQPAGDHSRRDELTSQHL